MRLQPSALCAASLQTRPREIGTDISEASLSKSVPVFSDATLKGKQMGSYFLQGICRAKPAKLGQAHIQFPAD